MGKFLTYLTLLIIIGLVGGGLFLSFWDIPAPTAKVEKVLPNDRFPK